MILLIPKAIKISLLFLKTFTCDSCFSFCRQDSGLFNFVNDKNALFKSTLILTAWHYLSSLCQPKPSSAHFLDHSYFPTVKKMETGRACKTPCCLTNVTSFQLTNVRESALMPETLCILNCYWQVFMKYCGTITLTVTSCFSEPRPDQLSELT